MPWYCIDFRITACKKAQNSPCEFCASVTKPESFPAAPSRRLPLRRTDVPCFSEYRHGPILLPESCCHLRRRRARGRLSRVNHPILICSLHASSLFRHSQNSTDPCRLSIDSHVFLSSSLPESAACSVSPFRRTPRQSPAPPEQRAQSPQQLLPSLAFRTLRTTARAAAAAIRIPRRTSAAFIFTSPRSSGRSFA